MTWIEALILGLIEGITEFLPISSTGHLIIASHFMGMHQDEFAKAFDVIIQLGAILTVLVLYWKRFLPNWSFYQKILLAFLPTALIGFVLKSKVDEWLENPWIVAWSLLLGGIILLFVDQWEARKVSKNLNDLPPRSFLQLGVIQSLAMVPGVSRSGATILGGMALGMNKKQAAEFSFFLAIPTMAAASAYKLLKLLKAGIVVTPDQWQLLAVGFIVSFFVAAIAIQTFLKVLTQYGFRWFGWYRIALGLILMVILR